jgi:hypothetical protein
MRVFLEKVEAKRWGMSAALKHGGIMLVPLLRP